MIEDQRKSIALIRRNIVIMNVMIAFIALGLCTTHYLMKGDIALIILSAMSAFGLIFSVLHMRRTIRSTNFMFPNDKLVWLHLIFFTLWFVTRQITNVIEH